MQLRLRTPLFRDYPINKLTGFYPWYLAVEEFLATS